MNSDLESLNLQKTSSFENESNFQSVAQNDTIIDQAIKATNKIKDSVKDIQQDVIKVEEMIKQ